MIESGAAAAAPHLQAMQRHDPDNPDIRRDTTPTTPDASHPEFLSVAAAALILGISPRTVQRRCHKGKLAARLVLSEFGEQWEIDRAAVEKAATEGATLPPTAPRHVTTVSQAASAGKPAASPEASEDLAARYIARLETENDFLRATVEQHQRSEAELRAALREALKAAPRQLTAGSPESAPDAPKPDANRVDEPNLGARSNAPQTEPEQGETGEVDLSEIDSLIYRVFK